MKKILSACIEQHIEFDTKQEMDDFHEELKQGTKKFKVISTTKVKGKHRIHVIRQYNRNKFPGGDADVC